MNNLEEGISCDRKREDSYIRTFYVSWRTEENSLALFTVSNRLRKSFWLVANKLAEIYSYFQILCVGDLFSVSWPWGKRLLLRLVKNGGTAISLLIHFCCVYLHLACHNATKVVRPLRNGQQTKFVKYFAIETCLLDLYCCSEFDTWFMIVGLPTIY